ncbi:MAG: hypothetical protein DFNUSKGM_002716, partial [Candidatus Fervidibacter sacchari]
GVGSFFFWKRFPASLDKREQVLPKFLLRLDFLMPASR